MLMCATWELAIIILIFNVAYDVPAEERMCSETVYDHTSVKITFFEEINYLKVVF